MQLINIYEYIDYINAAKQEDLPYPKSDMIYIYSKFLHLEITVDMVLVDNVFTNLEKDNVLLSKKRDTIREFLVTPKNANRKAAILFRELENGVVSKDWGIHGWIIKMKDLIDISIDINPNYYNAFCKQVMQNN